MFYPMIGIAEHIAQTRLRALTITTARRHPDFPEVPTTEEAGLPGFEEYTPGVGFLAPAGTPAPVVARLNAAARASLGKPETRERLRGLGAEVAGSSPKEFASWLQRDAERWARVIRAAGITGQPD